MKPERRHHDPARLSMRRWIAAGMAVFLLVFVAGGVWAVTTRISGAVIAMGVVSPDSGIKAVQHQEGGVVTEIRVKAGDRVKAGQILIVLDDSLLRANAQITRARLIAGLAEIARLKAERDGLADVVFGGQLLRGASDPDVSRVMAVQRALFKARRQMRRNQVRILRQKAAALEKSIVGMRAQLRGKEEQAALIAEEVSTVSRLLDKGQALKPRLLGLKRTAAGLEGDRGRLLAEIASARENISEVNMQITSIERDFLTRVLDRLATLEKETGVLRQQYDELERKIEKTRLRAPVDGRVLDIAVRTIGGVISPRQPVVHIVPENEQLVVEARVNPLDIDQIHQNQGARVVFTAFSSRNTPSLNARLRTISPAPLVDQTTKKSFYKAEIDVSGKELAKLGKKKHLVPGMPAEVFITTRERSPLDIILSPLTSAARRALRSD